VFWLFLNCPARAQCIQCTIAARAHLPVVNNKLMNASLRSLDMFCHLKNGLFTQKFFWRHLSIDENIFSTLRICLCEDTTWNWTKEYTLGLMTSYDNSEWQVLSSTLRFFHLFYLCCCRCCYDIQKHIGLSPSVDVAVVKLQCICLDEPARAMYLQTIMARYGIDTRLARSNWNMRSGQLQ
jgi:hypothetical protein